jgi:hypothetical protein
MAPVKYGTVISPATNRLVKLNTILPAIELWFGDTLQMPAYPNGEPVSHFVVTSANPAVTFLGTAALNAKLGPPGKPYVPPPQATDFRPSIDGAIVDLGASFPYQFDYALFYDPKLDVLTPKQAAPYRSDAIFRAIQAYSGLISNAVTIPLTVDPNKLNEAAVMLQSLVHSALKYAAWKDCVLTTIRIVIDNNYAPLVAAFDRLAAIEVNMQNFNTAGQLNLPGWGQTSYPGFVSEANTWIAKKYPAAVFPDPVTTRQVFGLYLYTSDYFHPLQGGLLQVDPKLPIGSDGIGFTDLNNVNYQSLIPLYAAISSGLMNIRAFHGTTYRGENTNWNLFKPGSKVRYLNYVSSALQYPEKGKLNWPYPTPPPWNNTSHSRLQSQSARDIAPYSKHGYETEHLFDHGVVFYITSHIVRSTTGETIIIGNEVPATIMPLL